MATLDINDVEPRREYIAAAAQTLFSVPFELFANGDLAVFIDGALQGLDADYTVSGAGVEGGGSITLLTAATGGESIVVESDIPMARDSKYTQAGDLPHEILDNDFQRIVRMLQQLERDLARTFRLQRTDVNDASLAIPLAAARINKFLTTGAAGELLFSQSIPAATTFNQATVGANLWPQTAGEVAASVTPTFFYYPPGDLRRYNGIGDGVADASTALQAGIDVANQSGLPLLIPYTGNYYKFDTAIVLASLSNPLTILGVGGRPELRYEGVDVNVAIQVTDTNGNDFRMEDVVVNADQNASKPVRVDNPSPSMAAANIGRGIVRNCLFKNGWMAVGNSQGASGISFVGGFSEIILDDVDVSNIDRATGAGTSGSQGCTGITISFDDINAYCRKLTVNGGSADTVTNNETTGMGDDLDCDGFVYFVPSATANGGHHLPATLHMSKFRFKDCKGRCLKTQADGYSFVRDCVVDRSLEEAINNAVDFDFQRGPGVVDGITYYANERVGGGTTWGTSHAIFAYRADQLAVTEPNRDGGLSISNVKIYSAIPTGTDTLPYFLLLGNDDTSRELIDIKVLNNSIMGGRINQWIRSTVAWNSENLSLTVVGNEGDVTSSLIEFTAAVSSTLTRITAHDNRNSRTITTPVLVSLSTGVEPYLSAYDNDGYVETFRPTADGSNNLSQVFRPHLLGGDDPSIGHAIAMPQSISLGDDATHNFKETGQYGMAWITNNFSDASQAFFSHDPNDCTEFYKAAATAASLSFGTGQTNPDVDGDLNIWKSANGVISIKNRLGSTRTFHLVTFGGNF